jgi:2-oxoglutarate ferredoxin oxidoreductase subunit delta
LNKVTFQKDSCKGCGLCVAACPKGIVKLSREINSKAYNYAEIDEMSKCTGCGFCAAMCPDVVIKIEKEVDGHENASQRK